MEPTINVNYVCQTCGSDDVTMDAITRWNREAQLWEVCDLLDNTDCNACGGECSLREVSIPIA